MESIENFTFTSERFEGYSRLIFLGPSNSGKTQLCRRALDEVFFDKADINIVYSKNKRTLDDWDRYLCSRGKKEMSILVPESRDESSLIGTLDLIQSDVNNITRYNLILDDVLGSTTSKRSVKIKQESLSNLLFNQSRHLNINLFVLVQDIRGLSISSFSNSTAIFVFKNLNYFDVVNHYSTKLFGSVIKQLQKAGIITSRSKSEVADGIYELLLEAPRYSCLVLIRTDDDVLTLEKIIVNKNNE